MQERKAKLGKSRGSGVKGKRSLAARRWRGEAGSGRGGPKAGRGRGRGRPVGGAGQGDAL